MFEDGLHITEEAADVLERDGVAMLDIAADVAPILEDLLERHGVGSELAMELAPEDILERDGVAMFEGLLEGELRRGSPNPGIVYSKSLAPEEMGEKRDGEALLNIAEEAEDELVRDGAVMFEDLFEGGLGRGLPNPTIVYWKSLAREEMGVVLLLHDVDGVRRVDRRLFGIVFETVREEGVADNI